MQGNLMLKVFESGGLEELPVDIDNYQKNAASQNDPVFQEYVKERLPKDGAGVPRLACGASLVVA